jgi:hypothetical protein
MMMIINCLNFYHTYIKKDGRAMLTHRYTHTRTYDLVFLEKTYR